MKNLMRLAVLALLPILTVGIFSPPASAQQQNVAMPSGYFRLTTMFREDAGECLEGNQFNGSAKAGAAFMDSCQDVSGQLWRAIDQGNGYFRLTTQFREGFDECLEGNQFNGTVKDGAAFMDSCQNVSGQLWRAVPAGDGYFRLTTMFREEFNECLEGNQFNGSVKAGAAFMDACQNVTGQLWKVVAADASNAQANANQVVTGNGATATMPVGFSLPEGTRFNADGSAILIDGLQITAIEAMTGIIVSEVEAGCQDTDVDPVNVLHTAIAGGFENTRYLTETCVEFSRGHYWYYYWAESLEQSMISALEGCERSASENPRDFGGGVTRGCFITRQSEFIGVKTGQTSMTTVEVSATARFSLTSHFERMVSVVDLNACGVENRGGGGFGERRVRTNSHGDVHIFTPDGLTYDFQSEGEFVLIASMDETVAVHTRQTIEPSNPGVSSNTAVAFKVGQDVVEFYSDKDGQRLYVNGQATDMPTAALGLPGGGSIEPDGMGKSGPRFLINWAGGAFTARVNLYAQFLNVGVAGSGGVYSGLIGNLDGNPQNDMLPRGGGALICPQASVDDLIRYGDSWRVSREETLLRAELVEIQDVLVTDIVSGERYTIDTALSRTIEQNFIGLGGEVEIDVSTLAITLSSLYEVTEEVAVTAISTFFGRENLTLTDTISVSTMETQITTYRESYERVSIETIEETVRAKAQRICQASGVTDELALVNCVLDVVSTKNETYVESAISFEETIIDIPREQRWSATTFGNVLSPNVILSEERVIEIVGSPEVVPDITTLVFDWSAPVEEKIVTMVTSNITSTFNQTACAAVNPPTPVEELEKQPQAGGVAIFCATHARGQTVTVSLGRTLDEALAKAQASCPVEAQSRSELWGDVIIPCREIGRGERSFDFGDGVLSIGRDVTITEITRIVTKEQVPPGLSLTFDPGLSADCMDGEIVPLNGLTVVEGVLQYVENAASEFQEMCTGTEIKETEDDILLQATCLTEAASDARTSAISLLGVAAMQALVEHPKCAPPEPEQPEIPDQPAPEVCTADPATAGLPEPEAFTPVTDDGLPSDFPDSGDFVLVRNIEAGIEIHARREAWIADMNQSVFTALQVQIGGDSVEIYATPSEKMLINGVAPENAGVAVEGNVILLPGGGRIAVEAETEALVLEWPATSFAMAVRIFPKSHIMPIIRRDPALSYEGLVRFTEDWILDSEGSGFSQAPSSNPNCNSCRTSSPPQEEWSVVGVPQPNFGPEEPETPETPETPEVAEPPANPEGPSPFDVLRMLIAPEQ
jgi:hypothetical protein